MIKENVIRFMSFVLTRESVRLLKEAEQPRPWTADPILSTYRFCNVRREDDKVTRWIAENWRTKYGKDPDLWFAMVVARLFNRPETLTFIRPLPFDPLRMEADILTAQNQHGKVFSAAYIVSTNGRAMDKVEYVLYEVLQPLWLSAHVYRPTKADSLASWHAQLMEAQGLGSFMAAQVVADVKNTKGSVLAQAPDWWTWAAPGPGSLRGLNRIMGNGAVKAGVSPARFLENVNELRERLLDSTKIKLCAQDVQNCLCEFDKYERARLGEGRPKQLYAPA